MGTWIRGLGALPFAALAVLAAACGTSSTTSVNPNAPGAGRCSVAATAQPSAVGAPGGTGAIAVSTNRECAWEAASQADWLALGTARTGQGDGTIPFSVAANPVVSDRRGAIVVNGTRVEIGQAAAVCAFTIDQAARSIGASGGRVTVAVTAQAGCAWSAVSDAGWISIASGATGNGGGTVALSLAANAEQQQRSVTLRIAGRIFTVEQAGAPIGGPDPEPPVDPDCTYTVSPLAGSFTADGGALEVTVTTSAPRCTWTAVSAAPWISLVGGVGETGTGNRSFLVARNPTSESRAGAVNVAGVVIPVTQAGTNTSPTPCTFTVAPTTGSFPSDGGTGDITVTASSSSCAWTSQPSVGWITIQGSAGTNGSGAVRYTVAPNTSTTARTGTLMVAGTAVTISQAAAAAPPPCTFTVAPTSGSFPSDGGTGDITVTASASTCAWTSQPGVPWITIQGSGGASGSGAVRYAVAPNTASTTRSGTLTVAGTTVTITQAAATTTPPPCTFTVAPTTASVPADGASGQVTVTGSAPTCTWTASSNDGWIAIQGAAGGTGSGTLGYTVAPNTAITTRSGTLTVAGTTVTITQAAAIPLCTFTVAPTTASVPADGAPGQVTVTASLPTCTWTATSNDGWIAIQGAAGGTGSGTLNYTVASHTATSPRTGTLVVAGTTVTVTQAAAPPPPCSYTVTPNPVGVGLLGDNDIDLHVVTAAGCTWTATSQASWITITSGASGTGDGHVHIAVAATLLTSRSGSLVVGGVTVTVNQSGLLGIERAREEE
jgi:hypothetical protein